MLGKTINERYRIDAQIGQGGMGTVYRAHDVTLKRDVALKLLSKTRLGTEGRARMLREAQTIANLHHPNIVIVHDAGEYEKDPFIVMELAQGQTLAEARPENLDEIVEIAKQICKALDHAHRQGIIHRDLKPENVIIEPDGNLKLMDFGLARSVTTRLTSEGVIVGTVFYMAPEYATGGDLDGRTDLYALGVMLYEFIVGELPFQGDTPLATITQHLHAPLVPPLVKRDDLPPRLNDVIVSLLEKDPEDRPESAVVLHKILNNPKFLDSQELPEHEFTTLDRIVRGRIVGRELELDQASALWHKTVSSEGQLLLISGEPGIGKTRLMREVVTQAEVSGGLVYIGECQPEGNTPYAAFAQIARRFLRDYSKNGFEFPKPVLADLLKLSPELRSNYPKVEPNPELDPEAEQRRLFEHMVSFCQNISDQSPLLLVLEDVHWADSSTLAMMNLLARRTIEMPVMLLSTYREVELDEALPFHQAMQELNRKKFGTRIKLERLDKEKTKKMLATIFAEEITPDFLDGIYKETEGNPFFIEEVCKALIESGQLFFKDGKWDRPTMEEMEIPQGVKVAIQSRLNQLSEDTQNILMFAAVIGRVFDYPTLEEVSEKDEDTLIDCLEEALHAQLIEELRETGGEGFRFSHALIPFSLRDSVSGLRRSRLHRKVAAAIEKNHPDDYERLAHHWGEGGNDEKGLDYTIKAAKRARDTYANQEAIRLYTEALALLPEDHPQRFEMLAGRANVYQVVGEYGRQKEDAEAMLIIAENQGEPEKKMDALLELANNVTFFDVTKISEYAEEVIKIAQPLKDKGRMGRAYSLIGQGYQRLFDQNKSQEYLEKAATLLKESGLHEQAAENLSYLSVVLAVRDHDAALRAAQEALELSKATGNKLVEATAVRRVAIGQMASYQFDDAMRSVETAIRMFRTIGDRSGELHAINVRGIIQNALQNFTQAEQDFKDMLSIAEEIGDEAGIRWAVNNLFELHIYSTGEYGKGLTLIERSIEKAHQEGNKIILLQHHLNLMRILNVLGQYQKSLSIYLEYLSAIEENFDIGFQTMMRLHSADLYLLTGDQTEAQKSMDIALELFEHHDFDHVETFNIWDALINVSLQHPGIYPPTKILPEIEKTIQVFKEFDDRFHLIDAVYSIISLYLALGESDSSHYEKALAYQTELEALHKSIHPGNIPVEQQLFLRARTYRAVGQDQEADNFLKQAHERLMFSAEEITTPEYRQSYLNNVSENIAIQEDYQERFGS